MKKNFSTIIALFVLIGLSQNALAASVGIGSVLTKPEDGWTRHNDTDEKIQYIGSGWGTNVSISYYGGQRHYSSKASLNDSIYLKFSGTKIRIISSVYRHTQVSYR